MPNAKQWFQQRYQAAKARPNSPLAVIARYPLTAALVFGGFSLVFAIALTLVGKAGFKAASVISWLIGSSLLKGAGILLGIVVIGWLLMKLPKPKFAGWIKGLATVFVFTLITLGFIKFVKSRQKHPTEAELRWREQVLAEADARSKPVKDSVFHLMVSDTAWSETIVGGLTKCINWRRQDSVAFKVMFVDTPDSAVVYFPKVITRDTKLETISKKGQVLRTVSMGEDGGFMFRDPTAIRLQTIGEPADFRIEITRH